MAACFGRSVTNLSVRDAQQCRRCCRIARQCAERVRSEVTRENTQRTSLAVQIHFWHCTGPTGQLELNTVPEGPYLKRQY